MSKARLRLKIKMDLDFDEFFSSKLDKIFIEELCLNSGCEFGDVRGYTFRRGCVIFFGELEAQSAKTIFELHQTLKLLGDKPVPPELAPLREFVDQFNISEVKIDTITTVTVVRKTTDDEKDAVLFVHGWNGKRTSFGKLPEFIRDNTGLIPFVYEYPTGVTGELPALHYISENLDNWTRNNLVSSKRRFSFIGHSMGGLVIRKMLSGQLFRTEPLHERMNGVNFVASPYNGVWLASIAKRIFLLNRDQLRDLSPDSSQLVELNARWNVWRRENPSLADRIRSIYGLEDRVVAPAIASADDPEAIPIFGAGHMSIVKPNNIDDEIVLTLSRLLNS